MRRIASLLAALLFVAAPGALHAQSAVDQARVYFDAGAQAYGAGRFAAAVEAFTEAYALAPKPTVLFSLAQAERRQFTVSREPRLLRAAIGHFRQYLEEVPEGGRRTDAVEALAELEVVAGRLDPQALVGGAGVAGRVGARIMISSSTKDATVTVDGVEHRELPVIERVTAGKHTVRVSARGHFDEEREVTAVEGLLTPLEIVLRERPALLQIATTAGAAITVDGRRAGDAPLGAPVEVTAGPHLVLVTKPGHHAFTQTVTVDRGQTVPLLVTLRRTRQRTASYVVLGGAAAGFVTAAAVGGAALVEEATLRRISSTAATGNITAAQLDDYNRALGARDRLRVGAFVTLGLGAALGLTGAGLFLLDDPTPADPGGARPVSFSFGPRGVELVGRF